MGVYDQQYVKSSRAALTCCFVIPPPCVTVAGTGLPIIEHVIEFRGWFALREYRDHVKVYATRGFVNRYEAFSP